MESAEQTLADTQELFEMARSEGAGGPLAIKQGRMAGKHCRAMAAQLA